MAVAPIVESTVRYREGRKWKERWCILKKPSPVADCLSVVLYKDSSKQSLKSNLVLDEFCGIDTTPLDGEEYILSIICCNKTLFLSFGSEELREIWKQNLLFNFGKDVRFKVELTHGIPEQRLPGTVLTLNHSHSCNLFLTSSRISLTTTETSNVLLRHLCSWRYTDLKRYGSLGKNSYGIQVLFKEGEKNFVFKTHQSAEIEKALKSKVQSLVQSCGLFEQLICSVSVSNQSAFPASASNPSTPTYCISSESSKLISIDRRFSSPQSEMPLKSHDFYNNTLQHSQSGKQSSRNGSFCVSGSSDQSNNCLVRHFSECNLHISAQAHHETPVESLNLANSCEGSVENCLESREDKSNYINYETTSKCSNNSRSECLTQVSNWDNKYKPFYVVPPLNSFQLKTGTDMEQSCKLPSNNEFYYNESHANVAMMNGGFCANIAFDPLQPLPYRDLSQYDGESDEGYLYWLPGSPGSLKKSDLGYINISGVETKDHGGLIHMKCKNRKSVGEYLKHDLSSLDSPSSESQKHEFSHDPTGTQSGNSYVNVSCTDVMQTTSATLKTNQEENEERFLSDNTQQLSLGTYADDYIPINQLGSGLKDGSLSVGNDQLEVNLLVNDYVDMTGKHKSENKILDGKHTSNIENVFEKQEELKAPQSKICEAQKESCLENIENYNDPFFGDMNADLMMKIHMSPPLPILSHHSESQEYINLSSLSIGEPTISAGPPPRPPKLLNCIKEDVSESSSPPPLPEKVKHARGNSDQDFAPLPIPVRRRDQSSISDSYPKPPIPRRTCHSPINLHSSPPPGSSQHNRGSTLSSCLHANQNLLGGRPVSASSIPRHRKPNLTVDTRNTSEIDQGKLDTPIFITSKRHLDDLNRSLPALAIYKPRNGKEYVDRRRLAEESSVSSLLPHSAQRSPSVSSSVFTFDDKSVASNPYSGWYSSGEDSPKYPSNAISTRSMRSMLDQKWSLGHSHHEMSCNGSPRSHRFGYVESPRMFSTSTMDSIDTVINYADIDVFPGDFKFAMAASPPPTPDNRTVYAKIDVAATSAASKVGRQHAKQREDTLENRTEGAIFSKLQSCDGNLEKRKLSIDLKKQSSLSIRD